MSTVPVTQRVSAGQTAGQGEGGQQEENGGVRKPGAGHPAVPALRGQPFMFPSPENPGVGWGAHSRLEAPGTFLSLSSEF